MMRAIRSYFLSRLLREKLLLLSFIMIGTVWWLSSFTTRAARFSRAQRATTAELAEQQQWLNNRVAIEESAKKAASRLKPEETLDRIRLQNYVNRAASEAALPPNYGTTPAGADTTGQFTVHSINFAVQGADYETLAKFYLKLNERAPYLGIEQFALTAPNRNDASKLSLNLRISSVEVAQ
jgi:hypothetical protein